MSFDTIIHSYPLCRKSDRVMANKHFFFALWTLIKNPRARKRGES